MHVRKFEGDTLDECLKTIKRELGPDAIIIKTETHSGLKGAFKKKRVEITAAISEKTYGKKASVDRVLNDEQKETFYKSPASYISNMIDRSSDNNKTEASLKSGYGQLGLNRAVNSSKNLGDKIKTGLDDFLNLGTKPNQRPAYENRPSVTSERYAEIQDDVEEFEQVATTPYQVRDERSKIKEEEVLASKTRIEELERKVFELSKKLEKLDKKDPIGLEQLRASLRTLDIDEAYIQKLVRKSIFELKDDEIENPDMVHDFALREMLSEIKTEMPLFSKTDNDKQPVLTVLLSETTSGQTSMMYKIASMKQDMTIIQYAPNATSKINNLFTESTLGIAILRTDQLAQTAAEIRKSMELGKSVLLDYRCAHEEINETKKLLEGLRRAFSRVEVLICLSALHSELYNKKLVHRYASLSNGMVVNFLDMCMNFGGIFNLATQTPKVPFKLFGTGDVVPEDIESATPERLLAGIFSLK